MEGPEKNKKTTHLENEKSISQFSKKAVERKRKANLSAEDYTRKILSGDRVSLSRAITLIESTRPDHQKLANEILEACMIHLKPTFRIGISGSPGVGKSTFIEALGLEILAGGSKLAILAIDPSSQQSKGSILGDKTRMNKLGTHPDVFIRPSPAGTTLGGVARKTRESILLCEAAGFDHILIETVGVGQSEIAVHSMVDCFLLLLLPGAGDELQGIKRGIVEMADLAVVNKADAERMKLAKQTKRAYTNAIHLYPVRKSNYTTKVMTASALHHEGIKDIYAELNSFLSFVSSNGFYDRNRKEQRKYWLEESVNAMLKNKFTQHISVAAFYDTIEQKVIEGRMSPFKAAEELMALFAGNCH